LFWGLQQNRRQAAACCLFRISVCPDQICHGLFCPVDICAQSLELFYNVLVSTLNVAGLINFADTVGGESCYHQGSACPQVGSPQRCSVKALDPFYHCHLTVHLDVGAHLEQLIHIPEPVLPDSFVDDGSTGSGAEKHGHKGLHIGGESGMGH